MELYDALRERYSARSYSLQVPGNRIQLDLLNYLNNIPVLLPEADIAIELLSYEDLLDYFPTLGYRMIQTPLYLVFRGKLGLYQLMNVGYYAQHASVWLTAKGLSSVWQSGFHFEAVQEDELLFDEDPMQSRAVTGEEALLPAVLALGYPTNAGRHHHVRKKKVRSLLLNNKAPLSNNVLTLLEAARHAPSEYNLQPWRFAAAGDDMIHLFVTDSVLFRSIQRRQMREAAIGCAIGNMEIMAALKGIEMEYGFMQQIPNYGPQTNRLRYMGTVRIQKVWRQMMFGFDPDKRMEEQEQPYF